MTIRIDTADAARIHAVVDGGPRRLVAQGSTGAFTVPDEATYVRFECVGPSDTWDENHTWNPARTLQRAWTQPIWIT